ncbi:clavesin-1-like [Haematobia irritans]|uniref:clavesin-1-like n=1 Tax=Haematobia irritans TaxID=7368 RepID=UPI003F4FD1EC
MYTTKKLEPEAKFGDFIFKLELKELSESTLEYARKELHETPENIEKGTQELRRLLKEEKNLSVPLDNDDWLLGFLRLYQFRPKDAFEKIKTYYKFRKENKDLLSTCVPSRLKTAFESSNVIPLPKRDQYGRRILLIQSGKYWDLKKLKRDDFFRAGILAHELCAMEPATKMHGIITICDVEGFSLEHAMKMTIKYLKLNLQCSEEGSSFSGISLHILNQPSIANNLYKMIRPFISKETDNIIHFHGSNMESLHKFIAPEYLPERYGGTLKLDLNYGLQFYEITKIFEDDFERHLHDGYID